MKTEAVPAELVAELKIALRSAIFELRKSSGNALLVTKLQDAHLKLVAATTDDSKANLDAF